MASHHKLTNIAFSRFKTWRYRREGLYSVRNRELNKINKYKRRSVGHGWGSWGAAVTCSSMFVILNPIGWGLLSTFLCPTGSNRIWLDPLRSAQIRSYSDRIRSDSDWIHSDSTQIRSDPLIFRPDPLRFRLDPLGFHSDPSGICSYFDQFKKHLRYHQLYSYFE